MLEMTSDIIGASTALAGLILVFLGNISSGFEGYAPQERRAVVKIYKRRSWGTFIAFALALAAALSGLLAKWLCHQTLAGVGLGLLVLALLAVVAIGLLEVLEIK